MNSISNLAIAFAMVASLTWINMPIETPVPEQSKASNSSNDTSEEQNSVQKVAKSTRDVEQILQKPVDWWYDEVAAIEVIDQLKDVHGINVFVDQTARDDSFSEDTVLTLRVKNVRMATALRLMLQEHNATYLIQDGVLRIISLDVASDPEFFRRGLFDCRLLLHKIAASDKRIGKPVVVRILPVQGNTGGGGFGGGGGGGGGIFNAQLGAGRGGGVGGGLGSGRQSESIGGRMLRKGQIEQVVGMQQVAEATESADDAKNSVSEPTIQNVVIQTPTAEGMLLDLIKTLVDPDGWDDTNGDGAMMIMSGFLVVAQNENVLDDIRQMLKELETSMK